MARKASGKRLVLDSFLNTLSEEAEERKIFREALETLMAEYEKAAKAAGAENDVAAALGYAVASTGRSGKASRFRKRNRTACNSLYYYFIYSNRGRRDVGWEKFTGHSRWRTILSR